MSTVPTQGNYPATQFVANPTVCVPYNPAIPAQNNVAVQETNVVVVNREAAVYSEKTNLQEVLLCCLLGQFFSVCCGWICVCFGGCKLLQYIGEEADRCPKGVKVVVWLGLIVFFLIAIGVPLFCFLIMIIMGVVVSAIPVDPVGNVTLGIAGIGSHDVIPW